jgi:predicted MFS family arabinose efflux permease
MQPTSTAPRPTFEQWRVLAMLVICVLINYLDRQNLSVSLTNVKSDLHLSVEELGWLSTGFFWTYAVCQIPAGWLLDRIDVYRLLGASFFLMSLATALTGFVESFAMLFILRLAVGVGAAAAFPSFSKILASDYQERHRGKANAAIDFGTKVSTPLGIILGGSFLVHWSWRAMFQVMGIGAMVWIPLWFRWRPRVHVNAPKAQRIAPPSTAELLSQRSVWGSFIGLYCLNSAWYFLLQWFPFYLEHERHFSKQRMAVLGSVPFWLLAVSTTLSGWIADAWIARGGNPTVVRKTFLVSGMLLCTLLLPAGMISDDWWSIALFTFACFTFGMTTSNHWGVTQTLAGPAAAGKWTGMQNAVGNLAGITMGWATGQILKQTQSFHLAFVLVAVMVVIGAASYAFVIGRIEPIRWKS